MLIKSCTQYVSKFGKLNSGCRTGISQFSFQSQRRAMPKNVQTSIQLHSFHMQGYVQNPSSQASIVCESRTSRCTRWIQKRQRNQRSNSQQLLNSRKSKRIPEKNIYFCSIDYAKAIDWIDHNKLWKILKDTEVPDHLTRLLRNIYAGQEVTVRIKYGTMD